MTSYDSFSNDARIFMNALLADKDPATVTRNGIMKLIEFSKLAASPEALNTYNEMLFILRSMSDKDWDEVKVLTPWDCIMATPEEDIDALDELNASIE